jgi:hypothetical protein
LMRLLRASLKNDHELQPYKERAKKADRTDICR